jgi:cytochrome c biogenesis protein CcdA
MNKWTYALLGEIIGIIWFTSSDEFYGTHSVSDAAYLLGTGVPLALVGLGVGYFLERRKARVSSSDKN